MSGTPYHTWTVTEIYNHFPAAVKRWEALGQAESDIHWAYGREADALITAGVPAMLAYSAIGRKAGVTSQTIRKAYYTYKTFTNAQREEYCLVPYSVFRHARTCEDPEAVLKYYVEEGGPSVDEIEAVFQAGDDDEQAKPEYPRYTVGIWRRMIGLPAEARARAEVLLNELVTILEMEVA